MPLLAFLQLLDSLKYNLLWGGNAYNTKSNTYKLEVERPNIKELKDGPIANYINILASIYR